MLDTKKMYFIVDMSGNYYKLNKKKNLVQACGSEDADIFSLRDANEKIGCGKKSHYYTTIEAFENAQCDCNIEDKVEEKTDNMYEEINTPTLFDGLNNDWEECVTKLCYMSSHIQIYRSNLNTMLSVTDQEICDIEHYIELNDPDDFQLLKAARLLQEKRHKRREIKDEIDRIELLKSTFLDEEFSIKVHQSLEYLQKIRNKKYTPRKMPELFNSVAFAS